MFTEFHELFKLKTCHARGNSCLFFHLRNSYLHFIRQNVESLKILLPEKSANVNVRTSNFLH